MPTNDNNSSQSGLLGSQRGSAARRPEYREAPLDTLGGSQHENWIRYALPRQPTDIDRRRDGGFSECQSIVKPNSFPPIRPENC
jgi:hypothetical protein